MLFTNLLQQLKRYWRELAILVLLVICFTSIRSCREQSGLVELERNGKDSAFQYATKVELSHGVQAFRVRTLEATVHQLRGEGIISEMEKIKLRDNIGSLGRAVAHYQGEVELRRSMTTKAKDSVVLYKGEIVTRFKTFDWKNSWLSLHEVYNPVTDSLSRKYLYRVDFSLNTYRKNMGLFKRAQLVTDVTFSDPAIQVGQLSGLQIKDPPKRWYETRAAAAVLGVLAGAYIARH